MTPQEFREYIAEFAWFIPGVVISVIVAVVLGGAVARTARVNRAVAMLLIVSLGVILSATLTPSLDALRFGMVGTDTCDLSRIGPASWDELRQFGDPTFNVLLFVPLGLATGFFPLSRRQAVLVLLEAALPVVIELIQLVATGLDRACQSADMADNLTGLVVGLAAGVVASGVARLVFAGWMAARRRMG